MSKSLLDKKLHQLEQIESKISFNVDLKKCIRIDSAPQSKRISFPSKFTPFAQQVTSEDLKESLGLPKTVIFDKETAINEFVDCSSSKEGVCIVKKNYILTNSHAGTHADLPFHYFKNPEFNSFPDSFYNGPCYILDLSGISIDNGIQIEHVKHVFENDIRRLLIRTYKSYPNEWDDNFVYFSVECAKFLANQKNLVLIGIDSASVDHPKASPIDKKSHGAFARGCVAIMEGLEFTNLSFGDKKGIMQTIWNPYQMNDDARGCIVNFYEC